MLSLSFNEQLTQPLLVVCFFLPTFLVYAYEASVSLRVWLIVQELPPPPRIQSPGSEDSKLRNDLDNRITHHANQDTSVPLFLLLPFVSNLLAAMFTHETPSHSDVRTRLLLSLPLVHMSARTMDTLVARDLELGELFAVRASNGIPFLMFDKEHKRLKFRFPIAALLYGAFIASYVLLMEGILSSYFSYYLVLAFLVITGHKRATFVRFQGRKKVALTLAIAFIVNIGLAVSSRQDSGDGSNTNYNTVRHVEWGSLLISCFLSYLPFEVVALCYRFDYSRAKERGEVSTSNSTAGLRDSTKMDIQSLLDVQLPLESEPYYGIRLPSLRSSAIFDTADPQFPKPYYRTALSSLGLSALLVILLSSDLIGLKFSGLTRFDTIGICLMPLTLPVMYLLVLLRAAGRGELRLLWDYEERWQSSPLQLQVYGLAPLEDRKELDMPTTIPGSASDSIRLGISEELEVAV